jgi:hypothetical protein
MSFDPTARNPLAQPAHSQNRAGQEGVNYPSMPGAVGNHEARLAELERRQRRKVEPVLKATGSGGGEWDIVVVPYDSSLAATPPSSSYGTVVLPDYSTDAAPLIQPLLDAYYNDYYYGLKMLILDGSMTMGMIEIDTWNGTVHFMNTYIESTFTADQDSNWMIYFNACGWTSVTGNASLECKGGGSTGTGGTVNSSAGIRFRNGDNISVRGNIWISGFGTPFLNRSAFIASFEGLDVETSAQSQYAIVDLGSYGCVYKDCLIDGGSTTPAYLDFDGSKMIECEIDSVMSLDNFVYSSVTNCQINGHNLTNDTYPPVLIHLGISSIFADNLVYTSPSSTNDMGAAIHMSDNDDVDVHDNQIWIGSYLSGGGTMDGIRLKDKNTFCRVHDNLIRLGVSYPQSTATTSIYGRNAIRVEDGSVVGGGDNYGNIVANNDVRDNDGSPSGFAQIYARNGIWDDPIHDEGVDTQFGPGNYKTAAAGGYS